MFEAIFSSADKRWECFKNEGKLLFFENASDGSRTLIKTPKNAPLSTDKPEIAKQIIDDLSKYGTSEKRIISILPWQFSLIDFHETKTRDKSAKELSRSLLMSLDWTMKNSNKSDEWFLYFGEKDARKKSVTEWIARCSTEQLNAIECIGSAYKSLNVAYVLGKIIETYPKEDRPAQYQQFALIIASVSKYNSIDSFIKAAGIFELYYEPSVLQNGAAGAASSVSFSAPSRHKKAAPPITPKKIALIVVGILLILLFVLWLLFFRVKNIYFPETRIGLIVNEEMPISVEIEPSRALFKFYSLSSSDSKIVKIEGNKIKGIREGSAIITIRQGFRSFSTCYVKVNPFSLSCSSGVSIIKGDTATMLVGGRLLTDPSAVWSSSNPSVATISKYGSVKALEYGETTISVTYNKQTATYDLLIRPKESLYSQYSHIVRQPSVDCDAPITVHAPPNKMCYVFLKSLEDKSKDISALIKSGDTFEFDAPIGKYQLFYATGSTWYDTDIMFWKDTECFQSDKTFEFYYSGDYVYGTELTLYSIYNGNMSTKEIDKSSFPQ